jgi:hypothetical protein
MIFEDWEPQVDADAQGMHKVVGGVVVGLVTQSHFGQLVSPGDKLVTPDAEVLVAVLKDEDKVVVTAGHSLILEAIFPFMHWYLTIVLFSTDCPPPPKATMRRPTTKTKSRSSTTTPTAKSNVLSDFIS